MNNSRGLTIKTMHDIGTFIGRVAAYLVDHMIIPPGGTVPASVEKRAQEWIDILIDLWRRE